LLAELGELDLLKDLFQHAPPLFCFHCCPVCRPPDPGGAQELSPAA
jgi:hypothetical protein